MRAYFSPIMLLLAAGITGCNGSRSDSILSYLSVHDGIVAVHAPGRTDADINAAGDLIIDGKNVKVNDPERTLLKRYYTSAIAIRDHGIATGEAGIATASNALTSVASGLASGNTDKIDTEVNASAAKVEAQASLVCTDLADLRSTQETLASQLTAFQPYALIKAKDPEVCRDRHITRE
jgi:hypothetical protein